jgi:hypothetical protein
MNRTKVWLPNDADPEGPESQFFYLDLESMNSRLLQIVHYEVPNLALHHKSALLEELGRNRKEHWEIPGSSITFYLSQGDEEVTVYFKLRELAHERRTTVEGKEIAVYQAEILVSWCSSHFDLGRAMVQLDLHKKAVALMGLLTCEFGGVLGQEV